MSAATPNTSGAHAVVISGASTGIGRACALHLDHLGFHVFAGVRRVADGEALASVASSSLSPQAVLSRSSNPATSAPRWATSCTATSTRR